MEINTVHILVLKKMSLLYQCLLTIHLSLVEIQFTATFVRNMLFFLLSWCLIVNVALGDVSMFCQWVMWGRYKEHKNGGTVMEWGSIFGTGKTILSSLGSMPMQMLRWDCATAGNPTSSQSGPKHPPLKNRFSQGINPSPSSLLNDNIDKLPIVDVWHWQKIKSKMNKINNIFQGNNSHAQLCCSSHKYIFLINLTSEINSLSTAIAIYGLPRSVLYI